MVNSTIKYLSAVILDVCVIQTWYFVRVIRGPGLVGRCIEWVLYVVESVNEVAVHLTSRAYAVDNLE